MKIAIMSNWNISCGSGLLVELVGRVWVEMGHELKVFAPTHIFKDKIAIKEDEPYVMRCYDNHDNSLFNPSPFLENQFDIFVVNHLYDKPRQALLDIYPQIRRKAKTVLIIHEGKLPKHRDFYQFDFDAVVCFDERYRRRFSKVFPPEKIHIIPYPCHPYLPGDKRQAREALGLPLNRKIVFNYGLNTHRFIPFLATIERFSSKYPLIFLVVTEHKEWLEIFAALKKGRYGFIEWREGPVPVDVLYTYLHASDVFAIDKETPSGIVVSSTAYLCLGSGCPLLVRDVNFFETLNAEVIKYKGIEDFSQKLQDVFDMKQNVVETLQAAETYVKRNSSHEIGKKFIELFESLMSN